jgi:hypothetical protein
VTQYPEVEVVRRAAEGGAFVDYKRAYYAYGAGSEGERDAIVATVRAVEELLGQKVEPYYAPAFVEAALWPHHSNGGKASGYAEFRDRVWAAFVESAP